MKDNAVNVFNEKIVDSLKITQTPKPVDPDEPVIPPRKSIDLSETSPRPGGNYDFDVEIQPEKSVKSSESFSKPVDQNDPDIPPRKSVE